MPKPAAKSSQKPRETLTRDLLPETRAALSELTSLIISTIPDASEKVSLGRRSLNFSHPAVGYFCGLYPRDDRVVIEFEFGVLLPDPDGILESNSCAKQVRLVRIGSHDPVPRAALKRLFQAAVSLPREYSARIALAKSGAKPVPPLTRPRKRAVRKRAIR